MKTKILIFLIVTLPVLNGMAQEDKSPGRLYLNDLQFNLARDYYQRQLKSFPNDVRVYCALGEAYIGLQKADSAKMMYQKAFAIEPKNPTVLIGLGKTALLDGNHEAESDYFDKARRQDKKNPAVYWQIAKACYDLSKKDTITGNQYLTQGMEMNSKLAGFHMVEGDCEYYKKNYGKAANAYERAIYFEPNSILAHRKLGEIYAAARFYPQARDEYNKCIEIDPDQIWVYKDLGDLYYSLGRYAEAEKNYKTYMSKAEVTMDDKERYALILFFDKKYEEASDMLKEVMKKNSDESVLLRIRGYIDYETGHYQEGADFMKRFFELHDPSRNLFTDYIYYAKLLQKTGQDIKALDYYKKALEMDSTKTEILPELAKISAKNLLHDQAIYYYQKMLGKGYDKAVTNYLIGLQAYSIGQNYKVRFDSLSRLQKQSKIPFSDSTIVRDSIRIWFQKAENAFATVTELSPDYADGYLRRGEIQSMLDPEAETDTAKNSFEKALAIYEKEGVEKNKKSIIECYKYLGSYAYLNYDRLLRTDKQQANLQKSTLNDYWLKVLQLDPTDEKATYVINELKKLDSQKVESKKK